MSMCVAFYWSLAFAIFVNGVVSEFGNYRPWYGCWQIASNYRGALPDTGDHLTLRETTGNSRLRCLEMALAFISVDQRVSSEQSYW